MENYSKSMKNVMTETFMLAMAVMMDVNTKEVLDVLQFLMSKAFVYQTIIVEMVNYKHNTAKNVMMGT